MHAWEAIEQSLDFIEEHLAEEISTEELANIASLSPFYLQRLFKRLVGTGICEAPPSGKGNRKSEGYGPKDS